MSEETFHITVNGSTRILTGDDAAAFKAEQDAKMILNAESNKRFWVEVRNSVLASSDWTQLPDIQLTDEVKAQWAVYRQALRDITTLENWPELTYEDWPLDPDGNKAIPAPPEVSGE